MKRIGRREGKTGFSLRVQRAGSQQSLCWHGRRGGCCEAGGSPEKPTENHFFQKRASFWPLE